MREKRRVHVTKRDGYSCAGYFEDVVFFMLLYFAGFWVLPGVLSHDTYILCKRKKYYVPDL